MTIAALTPSTHFPAPDETTAPAPPEHRGIPRDGVRMLVARAPEAIEHRVFHDLPGELEPGDLLVVNTSATIAGETDAIRVGSGPAVVHVSTRLDDGTWVVELRTAPDAQRPILDAEPGQVVELAGATLTLLAPYPREHSSPTGVGNRLWRAAVAGDLPATLGRTGRPIAYGYLDRRYPLADYQTVFGIDPGSAEMPSAARPFTTGIVTALITRGIAVSPVTLHTGLSSQEAGEAPQPERFGVPVVTANAVNATRARGGRVVAVGTTVTRAHRVGRRHRRAGPRRPRLDRAGDLPRRSGPGRGRADHGLAQPRGLAPDARGVRRRSGTDPGGVRRSRRRGLPVARVRRLRVAPARADVTRRIATVGRYAARRA